MQFILVFQSSMFLYFLDYESLQCVKWNEEKSASKLKSLSEVNICWNTFDIL